MRKLKILMITSILIITVASPIFAEDIVTRPDNDGYYSKNAHQGQGQKLGGKSGDKSKKGLDRASERSKGVDGQKDKVEK